MKQRSNDYHSSTRLQVRRKCNEDSNTTENEFELSLKRKSKERKTSVKHEEFAL